MSSFDDFYGVPKNCPPGTCIKEIIREVTLDICGLEKCLLCGQETWIFADPGRVQERKMRELYKENFERSEKEICYESPHL
jgi:hypothetical protein